MKHGQRLLIVALVTGVLAVALALLAAGGQGPLTRQKHNLQPRAGALIRYPGTGFLVPGYRFPRGKDGTATP